MVNDPIADFIIRIKNAGMVGKEVIVLPYSKLKHAIADKLAEAGFVTRVETQGKHTAKELVVTLKYTDDKKHVVSEVQRLSKPGRRLYIKSADIHRIKYGKGKILLSTPKGILTGEEAKDANVGGEQLFTIW